MKKKIIRGMSGAWWLVALLFPVLLHAQSNRGTLTGTITDTSSAAIAGAAVTATNEATSSKYSTQSSMSGDYTISELPFGQYDVSVSFQGFQTLESKGVVINANQSTRFNGQLQVGQQVQTVEVTSVAPTVHQDSATVEESFTSKQISELPLTIGAFNVRSPEAFTFFTPGVSGDTFRSRVNGGPQFSNEVLVDGASTTRSENGPAFDETAPSIESFGEFTIKTNDFAPEYGASGSSITSFAYKSGTNHIHGDVYDFLRATPLDAAGFYDTGRCTIAGKKSTSQGDCNNRALNPQRRPTLDQKNDFGFTAGGPFVIPKIYNGRDRTFWFFSYEGIRLANEFNVNPVRVPTARQLTGDFSEFLNLKDGVGNPAPILVYDPLTGQPFPGNIIPQSRFSSVSNYALQFMPHANQVDPATGLTDMYVNGIPLALTVNMFTMVADHNLTERQKLHYSFSYRKNFRTRDPSNLLAGSDPLTQLRRQDFRTRYHRASYDYTLRPNLINHLNLAFNRTTSVNGSVTVGDHFVSKSGLKGVADTHTPTQNLPGYITLGNAEFNDNIDNGYQIADNMGWVKGKHTFKFGIDVHRQLYDPKTQNNGAGTFFFDPRYTSSPTGAALASPGDAWATYLLGGVQNVNFNLNEVNPGWRRLYWASFIQDDFKVTRKLTINYGLRWDISDPRSEVFNRTSSLDPHLPNPAAGNRPGAFAIAKPGHTHFDKRDWKDFGPRLGINYAVNDKTVLHAGYGIYYAQLFYSDFGEHSKQGFDASPVFDGSGDGHTPAFLWQNGVPQNFARPPFTDPSSLNTREIDFLSPDARAPLVQNWNLGIERQFGNSLTINAAYVGTKGSRLYRAFDPEQILPKYLALGTLLMKNVNDPAVTAAGFSSPYPSFTTDYGDPTLARSLRPFPQYNAISYMNQTDGFSSYHAFQLKVEKRFSQGMQFLVAYTASKTLTDADSELPFSAFVFTQNDYNGREEKSISSDDVPQILALSYIYDLPVGKGKRFLNQGGIVDKVLGGWEVSGLMQYHSGVGMTIGADCGSSLGAVFAGGCRASKTGVQQLLGSGASGHPDPNNGKPYLNAAGFTVPAPFHYGNTERVESHARGFGYANENFGLLKTTKITESVGLQFRFETFNVLNRAIFNNPDTFVGSSALDGTITRNSHFGFYSGQANTPRVMQIGLKLLF